MSALKYVIRAKNEGQTKVLEVEINATFDDVKKKIQELFKGKQITPLVCASTKSNITVNHFQSLSITTTHNTLQYYTSKHLSSHLSAQSSSIQHHEFTHNKEYFFTPKLYTQSIIFNSTLLLFISFFIERRRIQGSS